MKKTPYSDKMDRIIPHGYHPTPQFKRDEYLILNGEWDFAVTEGEECLSYPERILVPFAPESHLSGIERAIRQGELLHYRRKFDLPQNMKGKRVLLHFGAVDGLARAFVNGTEVGTHIGGYTPFSFDITERLRDGENEISLTVRDTLDPKYPYGKQKYKRGGMWYTPVSGIWQTVWLEGVPFEYFRDMRLTQERGGIRLEVSGIDGEKKITLREDGRVLTFTGDEIFIDGCGLAKWSPESPALHCFTLEGGEDRVESYFALRTVDVRDIGCVKRICLNGEPYLFNGLLDQGYFPDGIYTPATEDAYLDDIMRIKAQGFNMLRKHIKLEPMIFYHLCDKYGVAVFQDMVNNGRYRFIRDTALPTVSTDLWQRLPDRHINRDPDTRMIFEDCMYKTVDAVYNSPSVVYYTIFNEGWGQFCADKMYEKLRAYDGTRIIDSTSGWFRGKRTDVDSRHIYFRKLKVKKRDLGLPLVISEFGGYAYGVEGHIYSEDSFGYKTLKSGDEYEDAVTRLYDTEVRELVKEGVSALVYTQVSDVEDEINGLITYDREEVKLKSDRLKRINDELFELSRQK